MKTLHINHSIRSIINSITPLKKNINQETTFTHSNMAYNLREAIEKSITESPEIHPYELMRASIILSKDPAHPRILANHLMVCYPHDFGLVQPKVLVFAHKDKHSIIKDHGFEVGTNTLFDTVNNLSAYGITNSGMEFHCLHNRCLRSI